MEPVIRLFGELRREGLELSVLPYKSGGHPSRSSDPRCFESPSSLLERTRHWISKFTMSNNDSKEFYISEPVGVSAGSSEDGQGLWKRTKGRAALQSGDSRMSPGTKWSNKGTIEFEKWVEQPY